MYASDDVHKTIKKVVRVYTWYFDVQNMPC